MRINRIKLTNYRKFRSAELEFGDGIISINGLNGAGKSTLVEAIAWALYGNEKRILRDKKEGVKYAGAAPSDICSVELDFEMEGNSYHLVREMRGKNGTMVAEVSVNGMVQASTDREVGEFIQKTLGMDHEGFLISVFARQKELNALSDLSREQRKKKIERMLGLDAIDDARKMISGDRNEVSSRLSGMRVTLYDEDGTPLLSSKKEELENMEKGAEKAASELKEMEKRHEGLIKALESAEEREKKLMEMKERHRALLSDIRRIEEAIKQREREKLGLEEELSALGKRKSEMDELKDVPAILKEKRKELDAMASDMEKAARLSELKRSLESLRDEYERLKRKVEEAENDLSEMRPQIEGMDAIRDRISDLEDERKKVQERRNDLESRIISLRRDARKLERSAGEMNSLGPESVCPTCHRPLGEDYAEIIRHMEEEKRAASREMEELEKRLEKEDARLKAIDKDMKDAERTLRAMENVSIGISALEQKIKENLERMESLKKRMKVMEDEMAAIGEVSFDREAYEELRTMVDSLMERARAYERLSAELEREPVVLKKLELVEKELELQRAEVKAIKEEDTALAFSDEELSMAVDERKRIQEEERALHGRILTHRERIKSYEERMRSLGKDIERLEAEMERMREYEEEQRYLTELESLMKRFRDEAITRVRPTLERISSDFFSRMTDGKYAGIELDDEYRIKILDAGVSYPIERFSGGESDLANLCLRLAISEVAVQAKGARGFNFLVLDEIFGSQDTGRRENIIEALQSLSGRFSQILLISHIEGIKESASMVIRVQETEAGYSIISVEQ